MKWRIERHGTVSSTMDIAAARATAGARPGTVVIAEEQTAGRGRLGRPWVAPYGTCLLFTAVFRPTLDLARSPELSRTLAERVAAAIAEVAGLGPSIKEPNDLLVDGKKLAGILCQTSIRGDLVKHLLVGIGVNVNIREAELPFPTATSLLAVTGRVHDREVLLHAILGHLNKLPGLVEGASRLDVPDACD